MNVKEATAYMRDVSPWLFLSKTVRSLCYNSDSKLAWVINRWNERNVAAYLRKETGEDGGMDFAALLGKANPSVSPKSIFIMWWQGEDKAPALVKACIDSVRRHACGHEVIVISEKNVGEYIHLPEFILKRLGGVFRSPISLT